MVEIQKIHIFAYMFHDYNKDHAPGVLAAASVLLLTPLFMYVVSTLFFTVGFSVSAYYFPVSLIVAIVVSVLYSSERRMAACGALIALALMAVSIVLCGVIQDSSYDGNFYHQEIVVYLLNGWNPVLTPVPAPDCSPWSMHYAKAMEITAACVARTTGMIETGKAVNLFLLAGSSLMVYRLLRNFCDTLSARKAIMVVVVSVLNPACIGQWLTFYTDFTIYYMILLTVVVIVQMTRNADAANICALLAIIVMSAGIKLTTLFYTGLTIIFAVLWMMARYKMYLQGIRICIWALIGLAIGVLVTGYHPYITNHLLQGNPLYPLVGFGAMDIMTGNTPEMFMTDRFTAFFKSLIQIQLPGVDTRAGGYGPLMPFMLILSLAVLMLMKSPRKGCIRYMALLATLSCFIFPQSWWARYIPQLWLVVTLAFLDIMMSGPFKLKKMALAVLAGCVLVTAAVALGRSVASGIRYTVLRHEVSKTIAKKTDTVQVFNFTPSVWRHLREDGISAVAVERDQLSDDVLLVSYHSDVYNGHNPMVVVPAGLNFRDITPDSGLSGLLGLRSFCFTIQEIPGRSQ